MAKVQHRFTVYILVGILAGLVVGLLIKWIPFPPTVKSFIIDYILNVPGQIFLRLMFLLVVPIVLVSLIAGASSLGDLKEVGRVGGKSFCLYIITTALAVTLALLLAAWLKVGSGMNLSAPSTFMVKAAPSFSDVLINLVPKNPFRAISEGSMLQIIVFALLLGVGIAALGEKAAPFLKVVHSLNEILIKLILMIMKLVPFGVFFLLAKLFATIGFSIFNQLLLYFACVLLVLCVQLFGSYSLLILIFARLSPVQFFKKMYSAMLFAFSVSSSNASIPVVLETVETRLGVHNSVASFVIPLGSTINMDGTSIMQGVAAVLISHAYHINIGLTGYLLVVMMAVLASIGTAGVPGVGLITLTMVLNQVGLPVQGIMLIIGIDRLLDMARTAVNISGDAMIALIVGKSENRFSLDIYKNDSL